MPPEFGGGDPFSRMIHIIVYALQEGYWYLGVLGLAMLVGAFYLIRFMFLTKHIKKIR